MQTNMRLQRLRVAIVPIYPSERLMHGNRVCLKKEWEKVACKGMWEENVIR